MRRWDRGSEVRTGLYHRSETNDPPVNRVVLSSDHNRQQRHRLPAGLCGASALDCGYTLCPRNNPRGGCEPSDWSLAPRVAALGPSDSGSHRGLGWASSALALGVISYKARLAWWSTGGGHRCRAATRPRRGRRTTDLVVRPYCRVARSRLSRPRNLGDSVRFDHAPSLASPCCWISACGFR